MIWKQIPLLRVFLPFVAGILIALNFQSYWKWSLPAAGILSVVAVILTTHRRFRAHRTLDRIGALLIMFIFFLLGHWDTRYHTGILRGDHFGHYLDSATSAVVRVITPAAEKARSYKVEVVVEQLLDAGEARSVSGKALLYLPKIDQTKQLEYGDVLLIANRFREVEPPMNPGQFNYKRYLSFHNIYHQAYLPEETWMLIERNRGSWLWRHVSDLRRHLLDFLESEFSRERERAVASALLLGYTDLLDDETIKTYSSSGAMHVLAVSGLHVVVIFYVLNVLLGFLSKRRNSRLWVKLPLLLAGIWLYALLTGLSPSVQRAAVMLTFIVVGESLGKNNNIYSSLVASAMFLLALDPFLITEVGFLLSYLAVLGIVVMQRGLYRRLYFSNRIVDWLWQITCVSIAAQVATFPLGLVYFHQFPTYFLVSNLFVIPLAAVVLYAGLAMFLLSPLQWAGSVLADAVEWTLWLMNEGIAFVDRLPFSLISGLYVTKLETLLLYGVLTGLIVFFKLNRPRALQFAMALGAAVLASIGLRKLENSRSNVFIVYNAEGLSGMSMISGARATIVADSALLSDPGKMLFNIEHHLWEQGVRKQVTRTHTDSSDRLLAFAGRSFLILDRTLPRKAPARPLHVDYIIVSRSPYLPMHDLPRYFSCRQVIFDTSNPPWLTKRWKLKGDELGIACHDVNADGAFVLKL